MDLGAYTNNDRFACLAILIQARDEGINTVGELIEKIEPMIDIQVVTISPQEGIAQARQPRIPPVCPDCDRGERMVAVFREGIYYFACRSCRYSMIEG